MVVPTFVSRHCQHSVQFPESLTFHTELMRIMPGNEGEKARCDAEPKLASSVRGYRVLANWPLPIETHRLEDERIPSGVHRDYRYLTVGSYGSDVFTFHGIGFQFQPNAME
ncbi:uncharacterized protein BO88DRAFT_401283 [Aspergillus vadensis CBS 113365]|uniref:Uncharacterized protein n=1 Tax=Aspergillus vadensis (strain CBS 113365 / IMI 142717 / IBT 24658) TaxID=1448311 RepID=A0A319BLY8_ASPVC|nr:hypothetical protein BO88DRAFT_401283 [Aspergillus vadensis CBS 113365]PYH73687.1 hypothetical protein BO88DRAFT_401283 [Aspergillus vadensis CBS 113365]